MFRLMPPAGAPINYRNLIRIAVSRIHSNKCPEEFVNRIKGFSQVDRCYLFDSGHSALAFLLSIMSRVAGPAKNEVVIPAYTCYSVAGSIVKSKLMIKPVDIDSSTLDYNYELLENLDYTNVLAIIGCNLFGVLNNWSRLQTIAKKANVFLIDDAAQSLGSSYGNKPSGTSGDAGFYSLGRGKNITAYSGGALVTNNVEISTLADKLIVDLKYPGLISEIIAYLKMISYSILLKPSCYWIPASMPFLGLGKTIFDGEFKLELLPAIQACAGSIMLGEVAEYNAIRIGNARKIVGGLTNRQQYNIPGYDETNCPAYIRLPLICKNKSIRDRIIARLRKKNIVATSMYPSTIARIPGIDKHIAGSQMDFSQAENVVECLVSIPTHPYLKKADIANIIDVLNSAHGDLDDSN